MHKLFNNPQKASQTYFWNTIQWTEKYYQIKYLKDNSFSTVSLLRGQLYRSF